jgi:uncharacterized hydrophobic protein (TIGR00271 family)
VQLVVIWISFLSETSFNPFRLHFGASWRARSSGGIQAVKTSGEGEAASMMHLRVVSPKAVTPELTATLRDDDAVFNMVVLPETSQRPPGDTVHFDVLNGAANGVFSQLRRLGVAEHGSVMAETVDVWLSDPAAAAERRQSRFQAIAPVWELVDARIRSDGRYPPSWFGLLVIAGVIGAIGILINSQILIVAAMVVGPEYGAITSVARAGTRRDGRTVARGLLALVVGFTGAVIASFALGVAIRASGHTPLAFEHGVRPVSDLINTPNVFSVVVAVLAGVVGIVSLTESRGSTLIGVFISVTTIPAAADIGLSISYASWGEAWGSFVQLLLNVSILVVVGMIMLVVQKRTWDRVTPVIDAPPPT